MPAACGHELALIIVNMGQWEKQRAFTVVVAIEVMIFRRKRNPETYPCLPFSLIAYIHHNDNSHCNDYNRPSGAAPPLSSYSEGILPQYWIYDFSYRSNDFYSLDTPLHSLHSCTVWFFFFRCRYDTLPPGIFDTLALWSVQECKECKGVITEIYADTAALSAFSALSNSKMRIMQVMQMFFLFITP